MKEWEVFMDKVYYGVNGGVGVREMKGRVVWFGLFWF